MILEQRMSPINNHLAEVPNTHGEISTQKKDHKSETRFSQNAQDPTSTVKQ